MTTLLLFGQTNNGLPIIGEAKTITHQVCRINIGWNGKSNINNVYAAPSGW
jgi:hypothetical protein